MIVFAWILWSYIILCLVLGLIVIILANLNDRHYTIKVEDLLFKIAILIFLSIYLF